MTRRTCHCQFITKLFFLLEEGFNIFNLWWFTLGKYLFFSFCYSHLKGNVFLGVHLQRSKRREVMWKWRPSLAFFGVGACDTQLFPSCGGSRHRIRNTHTNVSAVLHFLFMLIASVGNLVHASVSLPVPVLDTAPHVSNHCRLKLSIEEIALILFPISLGRRWYKSWRNR